MFKRCSAFLALAMMVVRANAREGGLAGLLRSAVASATGSPEQRREDQVFDVTSWSWNRASESEDTGRVYHR